MFRHKLPRLNVLLSNLMIIIRPYCRHAPRPRLDHINMIRDKYTWSYCPEAHRARRKRVQWENGVFAVVATDGGDAMGTGERGGHPSFPGYRAGVFEIKDFVGAAV